MEQLQARGIGFCSLTEALDATPPTGRLIFAIFGALAEYERALIRECVKAGMALAKRRGVHIGRRRALAPTAIAQARMLLDGGKSPRSVARTRHMASRRCTEPSQLMSA
jgi:DNA invertase Pin-like site-specific DNA recombinase